MASLDVPYFIGGLTFANLGCDDMINFFKTYYHTTKTESIEYLRRIAIKMGAAENINIISDHLENSAYVVDYTVHQTMAIIFNTSNLERLLIDDEVICVLMNLNSFTHDYQIINKYLPRLWYVIVEPKRLVRGYIWVMLSTNNIRKNTFENSLKFSVSFQFLIISLSSKLKQLQTVIQRNSFNNRQCKKDKEFQKMMTDLGFQL